MKNYPKIFLSEIARGCKNRSGNALSKAAEK